MAKFVDRLIGERTPEGDDATEPEEPTSAVKRLAMYSASERPETEAGGKTASGVDRPSETTDALAVDYRQIGEHIASVLESARAAATKIRDDAREDAHRVAERAREEAAETLAAAQREATSVKAEAERLRSDVEAASREERRNADSYAADTRKTAQGEAARIVDEAKEHARKHVRATEERSRSLDRNIGLAEERLTQLAGGLRDLAGRLEKVVAGDKDAAEPTDARAVDPSLDESLRASASAHSPGDRTT